MSIEIKEVLSKKDLKTWVRFPSKLYKGNEYFVPFLENDEIDVEQVKEKLLSLQYIRDEIAAWKGN